MRTVLPLFSLLLAATVSQAAPKPPGPEYYRELTKRIRTSGEFSVPFPSADQHFDYKFELGEPAYKEVKVGDYAVDLERRGRFLRSFWDRISLKDGSRVILNGKEIPLTCIFVQGQDNRWAFEPNPLFPELVIKVTLVANDFQCVGPLNPNWPMNGDRKLNWDTAVQFTVKDPTIMLPVDASIRYRWNEYEAVLQK
jgi:hypothetical protein